MASVSSSSEEHLKVVYMHGLVCSPEVANFNYKEGFFRGISLNNSTDNLAGADARNRDAED